MTTNGRGTAKAAVNRFFRETFRRHTGSEYGEVFTRGLRDREGVNAVYPWLYIRFFLVLFVLYGAFILTLRLVNNALLLPAAVLFGGLTFSVPFIVFLYELYPKRDFSLLALLGVVVIGGGAAILACQVLSYILPSAESAWAGCFRTGAIEEICKGVVAIAVIAVMGAKDPMLGFMVGAAVGAGFSVFEDMGYLFVNSGYYYTGSVSTAVQVFYSRGFTVFCSHIVWTALVGWAFARFRKPAQSPALLGCLAFSFLMHSLWDSPLEGVGQGFMYAFCVAASLAAELAVLIYERLYRFPRMPWDDVVDAGAAEGVRPRAGSLRLRQAANITLSACFFLLALLATVYCALPTKDRYNTLEYTDPDEFVELVQDGLPLHADWDREYDPRAYDYEEDYIKGELSKVVQRIESDGFYYYYSYDVDRYTDEDEEGNSLGWEVYSLTQVAVDVPDGEFVYRYYSTRVYSDGELWFSFFKINTSVSSYGIYEDGTMYATLYDGTIEDWRYPTEYRPVGYTAAGVACAGVAAYAALMISGAAAGRRERKEKREPRG